MSELTWRAAAATDAAGVFKLFRAVTRIAPVGLQGALSDVEARLSAPRLDLRRDTLFAVDDTGTVLTYAEAADMGVGQGQFRIRLTSAIHPELSERAAVTMHTWLLQRGRLKVRDSNTDAVRLYTRLGFTNSGRGFTVLQAPLC